jgi:hypothetical protein
MPEATRSQCNAVRMQGNVSKKGGFFYCPNEVIDHRDRGQIMLACGQIMRKVTDQRRSAIRTGPAGSDKALSVALRTSAVSRHLAPRLCRVHQSQPDKSPARPCTPWPACWRASHAHRHPTGAPLAPTAQTPRPHTHTEMAPTARVRVFPGAPRGGHRARSAERPGPRTLINCLGHGSSGVDMIRLPVL